MKNILTLSLACSMALSLGARNQQTLTSGWEFTKDSSAAKTGWQQVRVPHDWAIYGPFDRANDLQVVAVEQNGETEKTMKTGRTGGLPFIGKGFYRRTFEVPDTAGKSMTLIFDGAMSNAHVKVNGKEVIFWPYGYNSFYVDITPEVVPGENLLEVDLENFEQASRWYPGAGLYRNVHLLTTDRVHIPVWGTNITTPLVTDSLASVKLTSTVEGLPENAKITISTTITDPEGKVVADDSSLYVSHGQDFTQNFLVRNPALWSPENPSLYLATTRLTDSDGRLLDTYETRFGIRSLEFIPEKGFFLNGVPTKFRGVCNHH
ncbi:MAG: beta-galactosidase, partial [Paramuribaculum sp.]|nr:beta-galactosidase [Paramuribaculum sp.]